MLRIHVLRRLQNSLYFCIQVRASSQTKGLEWGWKQRARRTCEARPLRARKTLTRRFTDFFTDFEKKTDCFAVYVLRSWTSCRRALTRHETLKYSPRYCWGGFTSNSWSQHLTGGYFNCNTFDIFSSYSNLCFLRGAMRTNTKLYTGTVSRCSLTVRHRRGRRRSPKNALCCLDRGRKGTGHGSSRVRLGATLSTRRDAERGWYTDSDSVMFHPVIDQTPETKVFCSISCCGSKPQPLS